MESTFVFLGTGSSRGVPQIGCNCAVCQSSNPKNQRLRAGALLNIGNKKILIDAGPDVRRQLLTQKISALDGCILTHAHYDHIAGVDDLKICKYKDKKLPCLTLQETLDELRLRSHYLFDPSAKDPYNSSVFSWSSIKTDFGKTFFEGVEISHMTYIQSKMKVLGVRVGNLAYVSDIKEYENEIFKSLQGVDILIVSALKEGSSNMHFSLEEALAFAKVVKAKKTYLTHIAHEMDHEKTEGSLPSGVFLAYDGLSLSFQADVK